MDMRLEIAENHGLKVWGASKHAIEQFIDRNKFLGQQDFKQAIITMLKMMNKAVFLCYDEKYNMAEIYNYGNWIFCTKESTIVTIYQKKGSIYEHLIN